MMLHTASSAGEALLGAMLIDPELIPRIARRLKPAELPETEQRLVYQALQAVYVSGRAVDLRSVRDYLETFGRFKEAGGLPYLCSIYLPESLDELNNLDPLIATVKG